MSDHVTTGSMQVLTLLILQEGSGEGTGGVGGGKKTLTLWEVEAQ